jgi:hypothetical protein
MEGANLFTVHCIHVCNYQNEMLSCYWYILIQK